MPSIYPLDSSDIETFTVVTNPIKSYVSSSTRGVTGSVYIYPRHSQIQKDVQPDSSFVESAHDDADLSSLIHNAQQSAKSITNVVTSSGLLTTASFHGVMEQYMTACAAQPQAERLKEVLDVIRFTPPSDFNSNTLRKLIIKDQLNTFYRVSYPSAHWAYSNYNTLNFFTCSLMPTSSVLLYPNIDGGNGGLVFHQNYCSGTYTPSGSFSFDFYINPRYTTDNPNGQFKAGTILHLSSTFALSLVTGSSKDVNGRPVGFRLQLQLSSSADIPPSFVFQDSTGSIHVSGPSGSYSNSITAPSSSLVFLSNDNSLWLNHWHHVVVRWGTNTINHGTGTFNVDRVDVGSFVIPSSSITPSLKDLIQFGSASHIYQKFGPSTTQSQPTVLCVGNYYEGPNNSENLLADFFASDPALRDGLNVLGEGPGTETPAIYAFNHPLNAELHDVCIRRCYMSDVDISHSASVGPTFLDNTVAFYVPPFFVEESPYRQFVNDHGGILITPFEEVNGTTFTPFSVALSFGVAGHYINLENFVRDFGSNQFPRLLNLTASAIQTTTNAETCNQFLYTDPGVAKRNLTILPCDDGLFIPSFQLLVSETLTRNVDDLGNQVYGFISLDNMVSTSSLLFGPGTADDGGQPSSQVNSLANQQIGSTPESPFNTAGPALKNFINTVQSGSDIEVGAPLTVYQRTQDASSNEVTIFDISNLFYGFQISPGTLTITEPDLVLSSLVGSQVLSHTSSYVGPIKMTLADNGIGNVYRADCLTPQATWNNVGAVYYGEGELVLKSPHVFFFGQNQYALGLKGEQHVHVMKIDAFAPNNQLNSSSNPAYQQVPPTGYPNDPEDNFVYISGINFHDADMNVVMKTSLAQPIAKRPGDRILFKVKYDW